MSLASLPGCAAAPAPARGPAGAYAEATDLAGRLAPFVETITKDVYMWSWFSQTGYEAQWRDLSSANDPRGLGYVRLRAPNFFHSLISADESGNVFGSGLYLATDPVESNGYGKGENWLLLQLRMPTGLRYFNLAAHPALPDLPAQTREVLRQRGCPSEWTEGGSLRLTQIFAAANSRNHVTAECKLFVRLVLAENLHLEGFLYAYRSVKFANCPRRGLPNGKPEQGFAFLLTDAARVTAENVRVFGSAVRDDRPDRLRVQSLFYKALHDDPLAGAETLLKSAGKLHPERNIFTCSENGCDLDDDPRSGLREYLQSPATGPYPTVVRQTAVPPTQDFANARELLWSDLDGAPTDNRVDDWMAEHLFDCH